MSLPEERLAYDHHLAEVAAQLLERRAELERKMAEADPDSYGELAREYAQLSQVAEVAERFRRAVEAYDEARTLARDPQAEPELRELAREELHRLEHELPELERELRIALLPKDEAEERNAILEIRAGTGGEEAALFAADLLRMYQRYAARHGWDFEILHLNETELGGVREAICRVVGRGAYGRLRFEAGVHRVQRVPVTESGGRIHTSTATVAVLPEAEEHDVVIDEKDLRIETFRASGAGGQHVNRTDSAVRITHIPTGITVSVQDERSQHRNRARAMRILRARLFELERRRRHEEEVTEKRRQIGTGDRSERIRTYNFPQNRVTDHRIGLTLHNLESVLEGEGLDGIVEALIAEERARRLAHADA